jgi:hypothetical protein
MPNKLNAYIDLAKLQGAHRMKLKGKGGEMKDCIVIVLEQARAKPSERNPERVNLSLSLVPNRDGKDDFGQTHWICEPTTKDERESANPPKFPILGNAREFDDASQGKAAAARTATPARAAEQGDSMTDGLEDDDIPF